MIPSGLAKRYARALFASALEKNLAEEIQDNIEKFRHLLDMNPSIEKFILSPNVRSEDKEELFRKTLKDAALPLFINFLVLLLKKERFELVGEIASAYEELYEKHLGILKVHAITAVQLDDALERELIAKLERETGKKIKLSKSIDPSLIGGMILKIENKILDGSIRSHLEKLRSNLKEVKVY